MLWCKARLTLVSDLLDHKAINQLYTYTHTDRCLGRNNIATKPNFGISKPREMSTMNPIKSNGLLKCKTLSLCLYSRFGKYLRERDNKTSSESKQKSAESERERLVCIFFFVFFAFSYQKDAIDTANTDK